MNCDGDGRIVALFGSIEPAKAAGKGAPGAPGAGIGEATGTCTTGDAAGGTIPTVFAKG